MARDNEAARIAATHARNNALDSTSHIAGAHARNAAPEWNPIAPIVGAAKAVSHATDVAGHAAADTVRWLNKHLPEPAPGLDKPKKRK